MHNKSNYVKAKRQKAKRQKAKRQAHDKASFVKLQSERRGGHDDGNAARSEAASLAHARLLRAQGNRQPARSAVGAGGQLRGEDAGVQANARHADAHAIARIQHAARIEAARGALQTVLAGHARIVRHRPAQRSGRAAGVLEPVQLHADPALMNY